MMNIYDIPINFGMFFGKGFYGTPYISEKHLGWVEILFHLAIYIYIYIYIYTHDI